MLDLAVYDTLRIAMVDLANLGKGHEVQHSKCSHSMANINLNISDNWKLFASCHRFGDIHISNVTPGNCRLRSWCTIIEMVLFHDAWISDGSSSDCCLTNHKSMKTLKCYLENEGQCEIDWKSSILYRGMFQKFNYSATYVSAIGCTQTHTQSERNGWWP